MRRLALLALALAACGTPNPPPPVTPSDDPADWAVDTSVEYTPQLSEADFIIPSRRVPAEALPLLASNNNVDLHFFDGRLYLAWRNGPFHFASPEVKMHLISSGDLGQTWRYETSYALGTDMREPHFLDADGVLRFQCFQAGVDELAFEPKTQWRSYLQQDGGWSALEQWGLPEEVSWELKTRGGVTYRQSYRGTHYQIGVDAGTSLEVYFNQSHDGLSWEPAEPDAGTVYVGGVSEVGWEIDEDGTLWAVLRNEDGDLTGFGSNVCTAAKGHYGHWECAPKSDPFIYESPRMFRHGKDLYLVARRNIDGRYDKMLDAGFDQQQVNNLLSYSGTPKRTALFQIDKQKRQVVWLMDLPGDGDTAFPGIARLDADRFLVANYTSPLDMPDLSWFQGQTCDCGTKIYLQTITFVPK